MQKKGDTILLHKTSDGYMYAPFPQSYRAKKKALTIAGAITLLIISGVFIHFLLQRNSQQAEAPKGSEPTVQDKLASCLSSGKVKLAETLNDKKALYEGQIVCYQNNRVEESEEKIAELQKLIETFEEDTQVEQASESPTATTPDITQPQPAETPRPEPTYTTPPAQEDNHTEPALTCDDYRTQYYTVYQNSVVQTQNYYNNAISNASMQCSGHGGCPAVTSLKNQLEAELTRLRADYESSMSAVGCNP